MALTKGRQSLGLQCRRPPSVRPLAVDQAQTALLHALLPNQPQYRLDSRAASAAAAAVVVENAAAIGVVTTVAAWIVRRVVVE